MKEPSNCVKGRSHMLVCIVTTSFGYVGGHLAPSSVINRQHPVSISFQRSAQLC
jgi:hypothetical protein